MPPSPKCRLGLSFGILEGREAFKGLAWRSDDTDLRAIKKLIKHGNLKNHGLG